MSQYNIFQYRLSRISPFYNRSNFLSYMAIGVVCTIISSWISACLSPTLIAKSRDMRVFEKGMDVGDELKIYFHSLVSIRRATFILTKDGMTGTKEGQERVGLPFKAMTWNWTGAPLLPVRRGKFMYSFEPTIDQVNMGIRLAHQGISDALQVRVLPLGIVPWAFALNVFIYAFAACILLYICSETVRSRRRQRSLCESCGYDLRDRNGSHRCPECGEEIDTEA